MSSVTIVLTIAGLLASGAPRASGVRFLQAAQPPQTSQPDATPASPTPTPPPATAPKPCPAVPPSPAAPPACTPATQSKKHKKKVVRDGGTSETAVDIAPGLSPQQASLQRGRTIWLLGKTDENLKALGSRQLNASQQDTVSQIKRYVEESKTATDKGDLQQAYTLANKARMLSGDLLKH